ncbi:hypothetical protein HV436_01410 [Bacillus sporothermodurans]|uniref:hypothetical protein n=1 Tax=Heyndrickxia sporothermodurans TaxID=46224 RepID=UPI00192C95BD|nr:hypothetical protein [Heyndrickxia sporothermodurans]MBL5776992.1 hypothetical protein [Heyndrickxia sporothermodurans]MBL5798520.1 hypothetical protein [Heyndrickxia sporothermodurans]MBL5809438.1 hypothetical protein [Heyndrickxia sporothermodurans]MBL5813072.1 hypothetical protein [Heyndrickxia sporothermodurans]MBL5816496.1 hypothetical protein [Heyndrickxia sporothermodurans]
MANKPWLKQASEGKFIEVMGAKIFIKNLSFGESRKAIEPAMKFNPRTQQPEIDVTLANMLRAVKSIEKWELTDEHDQELPITFETVENLDEEFVGELIQKITEANNSGVSEEEKKN